MVQKSNIELVAEVFYKQPTQEHYLKQIAKEIGLAHTSVKNYLEVLKKEEIIQEQKLKRGTRTFPTYKANINSTPYRIYKQQYNFTSLITSGIITYLEEKIQPSAIVIFGSYQKGEDTEESDIDIFIEAKEEQIDLKRFEKKLQRTIQLHGKLP